MIRRRFATGFGRMTAGMVTDAVAAGSRERESGTLLSEVGAAYDRQPMIRPWLIAQITGHTLISGQSNRWEYTWREKVLTGSLAVADGYIDDTDLFPALNLCECVNDGSGVEGPGWDLATAPGTFNIQPIQECLVMMWPYVLEDGTQRMVFSQSNVLDGACP